MSSQQLIGGASDKQMAWDNEKNGTSRGKHVFLEASRRTKARLASDVEQPQERQQLLTLQEGTEEKEDEVRENWLVGQMNACTQSKRGMVLLLAAMVVIDGIALSLQIYHSYKSGKFAFPSTSGDFNGTFPLGFNGTFPWGSSNGTFPWGSSNDTFPWEPLAFNGTLGPGSTDFSLPPTTSPPSSTSFPTTPAPSSAPTPSASFEAHFNVPNLPEHTEASLSNTTSPQSMAYSWTLGHPEFNTSLPEWRKYQLFAAATFFYALFPMDDHKNEGSYLSYDDDECAWTFGSQELFRCSYDSDGILGIIIDESINLLPGGSLPPEVAILTALESLRISDLNREDHSLSLEHWVPPLTWNSLSELSSLTSLQLQNNGLKGTLPLEIWEMTSLYDLRLDRNGLKGPIPPPQPVNYSLQNLALPRNALTGALPTQLGRLSLLTSLNLRKNDGLTGTIPMELDALTSLEKLRLDGTSLHWTVPSQLCTGGGIECNSGLMNENPCGCCEPCV